MNCMKRKRTPSAVARACMTILGITLGACVEKTATAPAPLVPQAASGDLAVNPDSSKRDYLFTPAGWYHRSCIHEVPDKAVIHGDTVLGPNHQVERILPVCAHPHFTTNSSKNKNSPPSPGDTGWVIDARDTRNGSTNSFRSMDVYWHVPPAPSGTYSSNAQAYFTFPGLQNSGGILQPVLAYGYGGYNGWQLGSWYCGNSCPHTPWLFVSVGDSIYGSVQTGTSFSFLRAWQMP